MFKYSIPLRVNPRREWSLRKVRAVYILQRQLLFELSFILGDNQSLILHNLESPLNSNFFHKTYRPANNTPGKVWWLAASMTLLGFPSSHPWVADPDATHTPPDKLTFDPGHYETATLSADNGLISREQLGKLVNQASRITKPYGTAVVLSILHLLGDSGIDHVAMRMRRSSINIFTGHFTYTWTLSLCICGHNECAHI